MSYTILPYSQQRAKALGVTIKPSTVKGKKIDVFRGDKKVASIGAKGYKDYPHYLQEDPVLAKEKRQHYRARHRADLLNVGTPGWYAGRILW